METLQKGKHFYFTYKQGVISRQALLVDEGMATLSVTS